MISHSETVLFRKERNKIAAQIEYKAEKLHTAADHLKGRWYYKPQYSLRSHSTNAVIDFVSLAFWVTSNTQARWVTQKIKDEFGFRPQYRTPKMKRPEFHYEKRTEPTGFVLIFQDPSLPLVEEVIEFVRNKYGLLKEPKIVELEVSVDFYIKPKYRKNAVEDDKLNAQMVALLMRHLIPPREVLEKKSGRPRYFGAELKKRRDFFRRSILKRTPVPPTAVDPIRKLPASPSDKQARALVLEPNTETSASSSIGENQYENHPGFTDTFYMGPRYGDAHLKVMHKIIDNQRYVDYSDDDEPKVLLKLHGGKEPEVPKHKILKREKRRARVEVTLRGKELNSRKLKVLNDLRKFSFATLQGDFFRFYHPTFKDPHTASKYEGMKGRLEHLMEGEMPSLFLRAGSIMVHEAQKVMLYRLRHRLKAAKIGRPVSRPWHERVGKNVLLWTYEELNVDVRQALENLTTYIKSS